MTPNEKPSYEALGVSSQKEDVHSALKNIDQGLYPDAFCKIIPDIALDPAYCSLVHADGAGTKSALAYMMYKETGNLKYFQGIVQDSVVMNVDDVLCVGANSQFLLSNTIGRNKKLISGEIISTIIQAYEHFIHKLQSFGLPISTCGGETADVGDLVRTLIVDSTLVARMKRSDVIHPGNICKGDVIVGFSSFGKSTYEDLPYNSGMGSNGLTLARHGVLNHQYYEKYPECFSPEIDEKWVFFGEHSLHDSVPGTPLTVGEAILSPTRTFTPILMDLFQQDHHQIHTIFHNTGGGQTKCMKFGRGFHYIKDNMFEIPPFFKLIQESSNTPWDEMHRVFNMGHRMEIICAEEYAKDIVIPATRKYGVESKIVGHVELNSDPTKNRLDIINSKGTYNY
ncbi:Phosphoribosylformylglycinamidine cyclo-ligase [Candidatus Lokiarchaeum ossiferum]|uniref:Phosphoribosylformylglycinamidine cyclo-ligase n=1 Tax=Candidatus Lokiarchaeum ossiferum TaxID=2951803 RepID=A0ABY6HXX3_9ARCH|nr:Phosphoribosylformylglycinamidine cyclo-ligase [Candidatus Lokiarchaeum sp. B-35]